MKNYISLSFSANDAAGHEAGNGFPLNISLDLLVKRATSGYFYYNPIVHLLCYFKPQYFNQRNL